MGSFTWVILLAFLIVSSSIRLSLCNGDSDPTDGFTEVPLTENNFEKQWPYNLPLHDRYSFVNGVRRLWVYSNDKPHGPTSMTKPRTEIRITGHDYSSGVWQFEGHGYVPSGTTGVCIMQIFGLAGWGPARGPTTLMLRVYDGALRNNERQLIEDNIYNRWFRLNAIQDAGTGQVHVFIDGAHKLTVSIPGGDSHYFKFGVYTQNNSSKYMESRWKGIRILKKSD